jgi:hypothetical protein
MHLGQPFVSPLSDSSRAACLIDEMPDQVVGDLPQMLGGLYRVGQLVQRVGVHALEGGDQLVETNGRRSRRHRSPATIFIVGLPNGMRVWRDSGTIVKP